jgi:excinuclease ABC subunit A
LPELIRFEPRRPEDAGRLVVEGLRQNNLKSLNISIPHDAITVVVGPSGSGKSTLAFDTLFAEGRWRFIESLSTYTRLFLERMDRPELDAIRNIRPAIAIEQKNPVRTSRSTVATATELYDYFRVLFARAGKSFCPTCDRPITPADPTSVADMLTAGHEGERALVGFEADYAGMDDQSIKAGLSSLVAKGYIRARIGNALHELTASLDEAARAVALSPEIKVVIDRLVIKKDARLRLVDSLETAFREGDGNAWAEVAGEDLGFSRSLRCTACDAAIERPTPLLFSFNHPVGACPACKGFGNILKYSEERVVPDSTLSLRDGAVEPWTKPSYGWWNEELLRLAPGRGIDVDKPFGELTEAEREFVFKGAPDSDFDGIDGFFEYLESKKYKLHIRVFLSRYKGQFPCVSCGGTRLKKSALSVKVAGLSIAALTRLTVKEAREFFIKLDLSAHEREIAREALKQIAAKLEFLNQTGLGYVGLDRLTRTLSGGEAQRVALANQMGASLCGVLYILDEPSVGLHPRDIDMLIGQIKRLSARSNTVVLVEHDQSVMRASDHVLELGPGAGERGGRLVYSGPTREFLSGAGVGTLTSDYLSGKRKINVPRWRRNGDGTTLALEGAEGNNLKNVTFKIPLKTMTCVTGVSGSGKSTLVMDTLYNALAARFGEKAEKPMPHKTLSGAGYLTGVRLIDQEPIGRTPRSNPITYVGGFDDIRRLYASLPTARAAGLDAGAFSFNVPGGRCEACKGEGVEKIEMYFLPDMYVQCGACSGKRYKQKVLDVTYRGKNIYDLLNMTFDDAVNLLPDSVHLEKKFAIIREVGLGYLKLGQPATTLSGGEAQRLKIAKELVGAGTGTESAKSGRIAGAKGKGRKANERQENRLYILDEPTTGLHPDDVKKLLSVLGRLVDTGNTVLMVEHNLDCMKSADHIIDMGPEGGEAGGHIVAEGSPEDVAESRESRTARYLKAVL